MIKKTFIFLLVHLGLIGLSGGELPARDAQRDRFTLKSEDGQVTYFVDVWIPGSYLANPRPFPMLLMLDGEYAFSSAVQISDYLQRNGETREFIVVGVSYGVGFGNPLAVERTRDFTPPIDSEGTIIKKDTAYYRLIKDRLLPQLQERYKIDPAQRSLWGYSLSGSFAAWLNYFDPSLFDHYILASGNLIDFGIIQKLFQGQIFGDREYHGRRVLLSYDETEIPDPKIVEDGRKLLANKEMFPGYEMKFLLTNGESHASSWFVSLPASLRFIFGVGNDVVIGKRAESNAPTNLESVSATKAGATAVVPPAALESASAHASSQQPALPEAQPALAKTAAAPDMAEVQFNLGNAAISRGDYEKAVACAEKAVELAPNVARYHAALGEAYGGATQKAGILSKISLAKKSKAALERAVALEPANVGYHQALFEYCRQAPAIVGGGIDQAEAEAAIILKLDPIRGHSNYVTLALAGKKIETALIHAAEIKKLNPAAGRAIYIQVYLQTKEYDKALAEIEETLTAQPDDYESLYTVGRLADISGQFLDRGVASLRRCLELTPSPKQASHANVHWRLGNVFVRKADVPNARAAYTASLKLDPTLTRSSEALKNLK